MRIKLQCKENARSGKEDSKTQPILAPENRKSGFFLLPKKRNKSSLPIIHFSGANLLVVFGSVFGDVFRVDFLFG